MSAQRVNPIFDVGRDIEEESTKNMQDTLGKDNMPSFLTGFLIPTLRGGTPCCIPFRIYSDKPDYQKYQRIGDEAAYGQKAYYGTRPVDAPEVALAARHLESYHQHSRHGNPETGDEAEEEYHSGGY